MHFSVTDTRGRCSSTVGCSVNLQTSQRIMTCTWLLSPPLWRSTAKHQWSSVRYGAILSVRCTRVWSLSGDWMLSVTAIFVRYHNLYPVMWRHGIIDMSSYDDVKRKSEMLKYAMFEVDFEDPRLEKCSHFLKPISLEVEREYIFCQPWNNNHASKDIT